MTSMDFYSLDKHCPSILSPPVISSTSCAPESVAPDVYLNGGGASYRSPDNSVCLSGSYGNGNTTTTAAVKMAAADLGMFGGNGASSNGFTTTFYNLDNQSSPIQHHPHQHHHHQQHQHHHHHQQQQQQQQQMDDMKKSHHHHMSFHHMASPPVYTNISCTMNVDSVNNHNSHSNNNNNSNNSSGGSSSSNHSSPLYASIKEEFDSSLQFTQCTPQSSTSPIMNLPDSPPIVSSNSGSYLSSNGGGGSTQRNMCIAKKSSTTTITTTANNHCYELKREMAESSGLNSNGAPYGKSRAGRKGTASGNNNGHNGSGNNEASAAAAANQFTDADSNSGSTQTSKTFVPCKVCGDKASGYHYGVTSCEGCKGFFRRSIQKQIEYRCLRDGKCLIIRLNRNRCQYCRFKKCLAVGMSRDSVRYGRVPKKSKEKERLEEKANGVTQAEADQSSAAEIDSKDLALYDTILTISQAHHANCSYTEDKIKGLSKKPIFVITSHIKLEPSEDCSSSPDVGSVSESMERQKVELWEQLALLITPCIQRVVEFAKRIPGFSDLTQDDQLILIKLGFFEVWLVHISKTADFVENTLTFADGSFLNRKQLELMFDREFVGTLFHLMSGLNGLALNDTEIGLFAAIILLQSDRPQIYDIKAINKIQESVVEALKVQTNRNHSNDSQTFHKLMLKINELRALGSSHSLHLQWFRSNWLRLKLPPLFAEIFDIPKGSSFVGAVQPSSSAPTNTNTATDTMQQQHQPLQPQSNPHEQTSIGQTIVATSLLSPTDSGDL